MKLLRPPPIPPTLIYGVHKTFGYTLPRDADSRRGSSVLPLPAAPAAATTAPALPPPAAAATAAAGPAATSSAETPLWRPLSGCGSLCSPLARLCCTLWKQVNSQQSQQRLQSRRQRQAPSPNSAIYVHSRRRQCRAGQQAWSARHICRVQAVIPGMITAVLDRICAEKMPHGGG